MYARQQSYPRIAAQPAGESRGEEADPGRASAGRGRESRMPKHHITRGGITRINGRRHI